MEQPVAKLPADFFSGALYPFLYEFVGDLDAVPGIKNQETAIDPVNERRKEIVQKKRGRSGPLFEWTWTLFQDSNSQGI